MSGISSVGGVGSSAVETSFIQMYREGFAQQFQQFDSRFMQVFDVVRQASEFDYYDRIGLAEEMEEVTTRYHDNPTSEIPHDRRRIGLRDFEQGKYMEPKDVIRLASDPRNAYIMAFKAAANRKVDRIILDRIFDVAHTGKKGEGTVAFVGTNADKVTVGNLSKGHSRPITTAGRYELEAGDVEGIDVNVSYDKTDTGVAKGITLDKLQAARFTMERLESVSEDEILDCWITSSQAEQLLNIEEIKNSDYAVRKALAEGSVTTYMNYRFRRSELLKGAGTAGDPRQCIIAKSNAVKVAVSQNIELDIWQDTGKRKIPYIYNKLGMDAVRMWGEVTCKLNCLDTI